MRMSCGFVFLISLLGSGLLVQAGEDDPVPPTPSQNAEMDSNAQKFTQEIECSRAGGICLARETCPPEKISEEGQCPKQGGLGAVCCLSLSATETRCGQLGGHCRDSCPEEIIIARANDCGDGEKCCPLV